MICKYQPISLPTLQDPEEKGEKMEYVERDVLCSSC